MDQEILNDVLGQFEVTSKKWVLVFNFKLIKEESQDQLLQTACEDSHFLFCWSQTYLSHIP
jgi:hypothetical protein